MIDDILLCACEEIVIDDILFTRLWYFLNIWYRPFVHLCVCALLCTGVCVYLGVPVRDCGWR